MRACIDGVPLLIGFGCHFEPTIVISRAITELSQGMAVPPGSTSIRARSLAPKDVPISYGLIAAHPRG